VILLPATILVVDDHPVTREPLAKLLRYEGFETVCAANGCEALEAVCRSAPDLILLDVMMPKMNGIDFLQNMRTDARLRSIPVIGLTGSMDPNQIDRLNELGVVEVMTKAHFTVEQLLERVRAHVAHVPPASNEPANPLTWLGRLSRVLSATQHAGETRMPRRSDARVSRITAARPAPAAGGAGRGAGRRT
jgi:CheY-like chemotaxis protein